MQPWEKEKTTKKQPKKKKGRSFRQKLGLAADGIVLGTVCCSVIYGSLLYECAKHTVLKFAGNISK
tara:strand:- start:1910 stop:2107 length:198 start_codon:yes stop_codon:yes gene_type:complete